MPMFEVPVFGEVVFLLHILFYDSLWTTLQTFFFIVTLKMGSYTDSVVHFKVVLI